MDRGITVISWDSGIGEDGRVMNLDPSNTALIGSSNIKWMKNSMGDEGEFAILSATSQATNQNAWIEEMKKEFAKPEYSKMNGSAIAAEFPAPIQISPILPVGIHSPS